MSFRVLGLSPEPFFPLYGLPDADLARYGVKRLQVDSHPGFPDRVSLRDGRIGERVLLLNHVHQPADTPYRASHAIFVLEGAKTRFAAKGEMPPALRERLLSLRAFDAAHMMTDAEIAEGQSVEPEIARLFADPAVAYIHAHYARHGCYAARIERA